MAAERSPVGVSRGTGNSRKHEKCEGDHGTKPKLYPQPAGRPASQSQLQLRYLRGGRNGDMGWVRDTSGGTLEAKQRATLSPIPTLGSSELASLGGKGPRVKSTWFFFLFSLLSLKHIGTVSFRCVELVQSPSPEQIHSGENGILAWPRNAPKR